MNERTQEKLIDGKEYDLGATMATYRAQSDTFQGGNWFVARADTIYKEYEVEGAVSTWVELCGKSGQPYDECDGTHEDECVWQCGRCGGNVYNCICQGA